MDTEKVFVKSNNFLLQFLIYMLCTICAYINSTNSYYTIFVFPIPHVLVCFCVKMFLSADIIPTPQFPVV